MLPVLRKRELVLRAGLLTVSPSQAVSSRRILVKSASIAPTAGCSGWRSNKVMLSSSRVRPPQRASTAEKQVASAIVGVTPYSPARLLKACQRVAGTIMRRRVLRTSRSVAGSQASGKTGAGKRRCFRQPVSARVVSQWLIDLLLVQQIRAEIIAGVDSRQRFSGQQGVKLIEEKRKAGGIHNQQVNIDMEAVAIVRQERQLKIKRFADFHA